MNDVITPIKLSTAVVDEQALGTVYNADTPAEADSQPLAEAGAPMQAEAALPEVAAIEAAIKPMRPKGAAAPSATVTDSPMPIPVADSTKPEADLATRLAEAEQRGYLRGRNEAVQLAMERPAMWQVAGSQLCAEPPTESDAAFLRHIRPSIWD